MDSPEMGLERCTGIPNSLMPTGWLTSSSPTGIRAVPGGKGVLLNSVITSVIIYTHSPKIRQGVPFMTPPCLLRHKGVRLASIKSLIWSSTPSIYRAVAFISMPGAFLVVIRFEKFQINNPFGVWDHKRKGKMSGGGRWDKPPAVADSTALEITALARGSKHCYLGSG